MYIPDFITGEDRKYYEKAGMGASIKPGKKPAVLVIDMTYAFVDDRFPLGCGKTGWPAVKSIATLLAKARAKGLPVIYSKGFPRTLPAENGLWMSHDHGEEKSHVENLPDPNQIVTELAPTQEDMVVVKAKPSIFFGTQLPSMLTYLGVDTLITTGMVTSGCIRASVVDAFSYNYRVLIPEECVADRGQVTHQINLFDMDMKYGEVRSLTEVLAYLDQI